MHPFRSTEDFEMPPTRHPARQTLSIARRHSYPFDEPWDDPLDDEPDPEPGDFWLDPDDEED
jgi:hypothetical protein